MKVVVTGGAGNVGRGVVGRLMAEHEVVSFDRREHPDVACTQVTGDILNLGDLRAAMDGADAVVHLAAIPHPMHDPADRVFEVNVMGTHRVAETAVEAGASRLVFASSDSTLGLVFGDYGSPLPLEYIPVDPAHPTKPRDPYGLSKRIGEEVLEAFHRRHGVAVTCLRYAWVWWPPEYENQPNLAANPDAVASGLWTYVDARDVADAIACALERVDDGFHIVPLTAPDTAVDTPTLDLVARHVAPDVEVRDRASFEREPFRTLWDLGPCREILGFSPERTWRKGWTEQEGS